MKRIRYFDLLRCISFCFIIFYHMISQLYFSKLFPLNKILPFYENDNMNIAMLGVAVFFILSASPPGRRRESFAGVTEKSKTT